MTCLLDPSAPGVSKQMMLDWMHINHPKVTIRPRIDSIGLAQLVRSVQPESTSFQSKAIFLRHPDSFKVINIPHDIIFINIDFPDPDVNMAAHTTPSASSVEPSIATNQPTPTTTEIRRPTSTSRYPKLQSLQDHQGTKPFKLPSPPFFKLNTVGRQGKRVVSSEVKESPKTAELGTCVSQ